MLLQPVHGASPPHCLRLKRGGLHGCALSLQQSVKIGLTVPRYAEITMYETLLRPHQVESTPPLTPISVVSDRLKQSEARREEKRLRQIANARAGAERRAKRKAEEEAANEKDGKRIKSDGEGESDPVPPEVQAQDERAATDGMRLDGAADAAAASPIRAASSAPVEDATTTEESEPQKITLSKTFAEVRGHTSYLTFAVLLPAAVREVAATATSVTVSAESTPPPPPATEASPVNFLLAQAAHAASTQESKMTDVQSGVEST